MKSIFKILTPQLDADLGNEAMLGIQDTVLAIVSVGITLVIAAMIIAQLQPLIHGNDTESNSSIQTVFSTMWSAIGLLPVALIILADYAHKAGNIIVFHNNNVVKLLVVAPCYLSGSVVREGDGVRF